MVPAALHAPPRLSPTSHSVTGSPPASGTRFSVVPAKNPMWRLSGDQNACLAPSVPGTRRNVSESRRRSTRYVFGPLPNVSATVVPSGEIAGAPRTRPGSGLTSSGNAIANRATGAGGGDRGHSTAAVMARPAAAARPTHTQPRARADAREAGGPVEAVAPGGAISSPESIDALSSSRSFRRSFALWYRRSGSFASARRTMRPRSRGSEGLSSVIGLGVSLTMDEMIEMLVSPVNGRWPVAIS